MGVFPGLERVLDFTNRGPLVLISGYQTPAALRTAGVSRVERWLRKRKVRDASKLATAAVGAAKSQQVRMPGEPTAADLIGRIAATILRQSQELHELDDMISVRFRAQPDAATITSIDGIGDLLGAGFLAATGGGIDGFASANHLAGYAELAPAPATQEAAAEASTGPSGTTGNCNGCSTPRR